MTNEQQEVVCTCGQRIRQVVDDRDNHQWIHDTMYHVIAPAPVVPSDQWSIVHFTPSQNAEGDARKGSTNVVIPGPTWAAVLRALREGAE